MLKVQLSEINLESEEAVWDNFMSFMRSIIPWEENFNQLAELQKYPVIAFIYESEVMREGHQGFFELHNKYISISDVEDSFEKLNVSGEYTDILKQLELVEYVSDDELFVIATDEDDYCEKMEERDLVIEPYNNRFYNLGNEEICEKIIEYVRENYLEFFE